jgi:hypothetical protein
MPHYEVLTFKTAPENVLTLGEEYRAFGWKRITKSDYKTLLEKPDQPDETPVAASAETVKREQTVYPDSPAFSDFGDHQPFVDPSPNDSAAYDGLQNMYFKRDSALEHKDAIDELKKKYDAIRSEIHEKEAVIERKKGIGHLLFGLSVLPLVVGFFVLMAGIVCTILGAASPEEHGSLFEPGITCLISGGVFFLAGFTLAVISMIQGVNAKKEKELRRAMIPLQQEKADVLLKASALTRSQNGQPPIVVKFGH